MKHLGKTLSIVLVLLLMLSYSSILSLADEVLVEGDYEYIITNGEVTIKKYLGSGGNVAVPTTLGGLSVTVIGSEAFSWCDSLISIIIPEGITSIGDEAFIACFNLVDVVIPEGVTSIGSLAFGGCRALTEVTIPNTVTNIHFTAFTDGLIPSEIPLSKLTIFAKVNTTAQTYAKNLGIPFITITEYTTEILGDINGDESINAADALLALQHSVRLIDLRGASYEMADMDKNDSIDAKDALQILQRSVGL